MTTDLVDWLAVEYGDAEGHEDGGARHVDHGLVEEQPLRPPAAGGKQHPALNDGALSHSGQTICIAKAHNRNKGGRGEQKRHVQGSHWYILTFRVIHALGRV